jgi:hypothetical protein
MGHQFYQLPAHIDGGIGDCYFVGIISEFEKWLLKELLIC